MKNNLRKGFTIIEVSLVLAIAGLIFLMVFVALYKISEISTCGAQKDWNCRSIIYHR